MPDVTKTIIIHAPIQLVWEALTDADTIAAWMGGSVKSDQIPGGEYAYFEGATTGKYRIIQKPYRLEYTWRQEEWPEEWTDSMVKWELKTNQDGTIVNLVHDCFPNEVERIGHDDGWDLYWLEPMKDWLESNSS